MDYSNDIILIHPIICLTTLCTQLSACLPTNMSINLLLLTWNPLAVPTEWLRPMVLARGWTYGCHENWRIRIFQEIDKVTSNLRKGLERSGDLRRGRGATNWTLLSYSNNTHWFEKRTTWKIKPALFIWGLCKNAQNAFWRFKKDHVNSSKVQVSKSQVFSWHSTPHPPRLSGGAATRESGSYAVPFK